MSGLLGLFCFWRSKETKLAKHVVEALGTDPETILGAGSSTEVSEEVMATKGATPFTGLHAYLHLYEQSYPHEARDKVLHSRDYLLLLQRFVDITSLLSTSKKMRVYKYDLFSFRVDDDSVKALPREGGPSSSENGGAEEDEKEGGGETQPNKQNKPKQKGGQEGEQENHAYEKRKR